MRFPCQCCGYLTFTENPENTFDICPVCFWEFDGTYSLSPDVSSVPNHMSLDEARANFARYGAVEKRHMKNVRFPLPEEIPEYDPSRDFVASNYYELLTLHRAIMEAKFCEIPNDRHISSSPILAALHKRIITLLRAADEKRAGQKAVQKWDDFLTLTPGRRSWRIALSRAGALLDWHSLSYGEQKMCAADLLEPFVVTDDMLAFFISQVSVFSIQSASPQLRKGIKHDCNDIFELFADVFLEETEEAIVNYNGTRIHINYRHQVPALLFEVLYMVKSVLTSREGHYVGEWPLGNFLSRWKLDWTKRSMKCTVGLMTDGAGCSCEVKVRQVLYTTAESFVAEWGELLRKVQQSLMDAEVDFSSFEILEDLQRLMPRIQKRGRLYRPGRV